MSSTSVRGPSLGVAQTAETPQARLVVRSSPPLRRLLVGADLSVLVLGWLAVSVALVRAHGRVPGWGLVLEGVVVVSIGVLLLSASGLYRRSICANRGAEVARIFRALLALHVMTALVLGSSGLAAAATAALVGGAVWSVLLVVERGLFREWIQLRRARGDFGAPVLVVGGVRASTERTAAFLRENPYLGFVVRGIVDGAAAGGHATTETVVETAARQGASGVVLASGSLTGDQLSAAVEDLSRAGLHVHLDSGLRGVDMRRITVSPLADETFLHVAPAGLSRRQVVIKRLIDVTVGTTLLFLSAPVLLLAAAAIKLEDRGPVFFRQHRVGQNGELFTLYKLRTMTTDADARLGELQGRNGRDGPLFKLSSDPRVTRVGRFLRTSSIDELPQLLNVLEGTMSLVGPRPALPTEVEQFDAALRVRATVKPGVTGLWQVEARDLPNFDLYRRYDLLYVRNWSALGDLAIIARTGSVVALRAVRALLPARGRRRNEVLE